MLWDMLDIMVLDIMVLDMLDLDTLSHVVARSAKLRLRPMPMLRLLSFMEDMDIP